MAVTLNQIVDAVATTLFTATDPLGVLMFNRLESYNQLADQIQAADVPVLQVYWEDWAVDPTGETDRGSFQAGMRFTRITIHVDAYAAKRGKRIAEEMAAVVNVADSLLNVIETIDTQPYFGLVDVPSGNRAIKAFQVQSLTRAVFEYAAHTFMGARMILTLWVY